jgi:signal transduction histidine kinase
MTQRLSVFFWSGLILILLVAEAGVAMLWRASVAQERFIERDLSDLNTVHELRHMRDRSEELTQGFLLSGDEGLLADRQVALGQAAALYTQLRAVLPAGEVVMLDDVRKAGIGALEASLEPIRMRRSGASQGEIAAAMGGLLRARSTLLERVQLLEQTVRARVLGSLLRAGDLERRSFIMMAAGILLAIAALAGWLRIMSGLTRALEESRRKLASHAEFQERVMAIVAHDLRSPLTAIVNTAELQLRNAVNGDEQRARRVLRSARRIHRVSELLLDLTRMEHGAGLVLLPDRIDMSETCSDLVAEYRDAHPEARLSFTWSGRRQFSLDERRVCEAIEAMLDDLLRDDPGREIEVQGSVDERGFHLRARPLGPPLEHEHFSGSREHEELQILAARRTLAELGGTLEIVDEQRILRVPWPERIPETRRDLTVEQVEAALH